MPEVVKNSFSGSVDGSTFESGEMEAEMDGDKFSCRTGVSSNLPGKGTLLAFNDLIFKLL